jgi:hypothetical protein
MTVAWRWDTDICTSYGMGTYSMAVVIQVHIHLYPNAMFLFRHVFISLEVSALVNLGLICCGNSPLRLSLGFQDDSCRPPRCVWPATKREEWTPPGEFMPDFAIRSSGICNGYMHYQPYAARPFALAAGSEP